MNKNYLALFSFFCALCGVASAQPAISVSQISGQTGTYSLGSEIAYNFTVENTTPAADGDDAAVNAAQNEANTATLTGATLSFTGSDFYGNPIEINISIGNTSKLAPESSVEIVGTFKIPNDGTLHSTTDASTYAFTDLVVSYDFPGGSDTANGGDSESDIIIKVTPNLVARSVTYVADSYEAGEIVRITYTLQNIQSEDSEIETRPLSGFRESDIFRARIAITPDPAYQDAEDFRLGFWTIAGDEGFFIPDGVTEVRNVSVTSTPPLLDPYDGGRNYQPQPDDVILDIGERVTLTQEFLVPANFAGTYFVVLDVDAVDDIDEQSEDDNVFISNATPRFRIISGPFSNTLPASEVTDSNGNQLSQSNNFSDEPSASGDGGLIAYQSFATNLTPDENFTYNGLSQIFIRNVADNINVLASRNNSGIVGNGMSLNPAISENGRYVTFESTASNLVNRDSNGVSDIFVYDTELKSIVRISINRDGQQANGGSFNPTISSDGRFVAFESVATNLDLDSSVQPGPGTGRLQIYVVDRDVSGSGSFDVSGNTATYLVSFDNNGNLADRNVLTPSLSLDADVIAFVTDASNMPSANGRDQVYYVPLDNGQPNGNTVLVSMSSSGVVGNGDSSEPVINGGFGESAGLQIAFSSLANNLVTDDTNQVSDVFIRDYSTPSSPTTRRVSISNDRKAFATIQFIDPAAIPGIPPANNPAPGDTLTLNGTTFTFGTDVTIGANAAATRNNLVMAINTASIGVTAEATNPPPPPSVPAFSYGYNPGLFLLQDATGSVGNTPITFSSAVITINDNNSLLPNGFVQGGVQSDNQIRPGVEQGVPTGSLQPTIDRSGALIAFRSLDQNLSIHRDGDLAGQFIRPLINSFSNVYLHNRDVNNSGVLDTGNNTDTSKVSVDKFGYPTNGILNEQTSGSSRLPSLSADGGSIAFASDAESTGGLRFGLTNVDPLDTNGFRDIFIFTRDINRSGVDPGLRPTVSLGKPGEGETLTVSQPTTVEAIVTRIVPGSNVSVEFFANSIFIGTSSTEPYIVNWTPELTGEFTIVARATESGVGSGVSEGINVSVQPSTGLAVSITNPLDGNAFPSGEQITVNVDASAEVGNITQVELLRNGRSVAVSTAFPFTFELFSEGNSSPGQYTVTAIATDNRGNTARDSISITIASDPPSVAISSPSNGDTLNLGQTLTITAQASSETKNISQVEFIVNGQNIGTDTTQPYSISFTPTVEGENTIQVFATDTEGVRSGQSITVNVINLNASVVLTSPAPGTTFSVNEKLPVSASVQAGGRTIERVEFLNDGAVFGTKAFSPFTVDFEPPFAGIFSLSARVTFTDGIKITSEGITVQAVYSPTSTNADFISQSFLDFFGTQADSAILDDLTAQMNRGELSRTDFITQLLNSAEGQDAISVVGAYKTVLDRSPTPIEYQAALGEIDTSTGTGTGSANIPISVGDTVSGTFDNSFDTDTYEFTLSGTEVVTANLSSSSVARLTFQTESGQTIAQSANGFFTINPVLTATLDGPGTFLLLAEPFTGSGTYTLSLTGGTQPDAPGAGGAFVLTTLLNDLFTSDEYIFKFGPVPSDMSGTGATAVSNRVSLVRELYISKYGSEPSSQQSQQGQLRMNSPNINGYIPYTEIFIKEELLSNNTELILNSGSARPVWTTEVLILALFNEQPTTATINEFVNLPLSQQIDKMLADPRYTERFPPTQSLLFDGEINSADYVYSSFMDDWVYLGFAPWYYSQSLGWFYTDSLSSQSMWTYSPALGWFWTSGNTYPWIYSLDQGSWLLSDISNPGWFYNANDGTWFYVQL